MKVWEISLLLLSISLTSCSTLFFLSNYSNLFEKNSSVFQGSISLSSHETTSVNDRESNRDKSWDERRHISSSFDRVSFVNTLFHVFRFYYFIRLFESSSEKISYFFKDRFLFRRRESRDDERQRSSVEGAIVGMEGGVSFLLLLSIESNRRPSNFAARND